MARRATAGPSLAPFLPPKAHRPFRASLTRDDRAAYDALLAAFLDHAPRLALPARFRANDIQRLFDGLKLDVPELLYVEGLSASRTAGVRAPVAIAPAYRMGPDETRRTLRAMEDAAAGIMAVARGLGGIERAKSLHDWLVGRLSYGDDGGSPAHEANGPLLSGEGVCEGVAKALKYLCDRCGVPCAVVTGSVRADPASSRGPARYERHAWNLVMIEGPDGRPAWFHVDATCDAALSTTTARRDYLCLGDADIGRDHRADDTPRPPCPRSWGYYAHAGRFAGTRSALLRMARQAALRGERTLVFQLPRLEGADDGFFRRLAADVAGELAPPSTRPFRVAATSNRAQMVCQVDVEADG